MRGGWSFMAAVRSSDSATTGLSNVDCGQQEYSMTDNGIMWREFTTGPAIHLCGWCARCSGPATGTIAQNDYPVCIGENGEAPGHLWNGLIDEASIYNRR